MRRAGADRAAARDLCPRLRPSQALASAGVDPQSGRGISPLGHAGGVHRQPAGRPVQTYRHRRRAPGRRSAELGLSDAAQHDAADPL